jgi:(2Fe-2S) ferredoxin
VAKRYLILVCRGPECGDKRHSADVHAELERALAQATLDGNQASVEGYSCFGKCERGVNVLVREVLPSDHPMRIKLMPQSGRVHLYHRVRPDDVRRIVDEHIGKECPLIDRLPRK